MAAPNLKALDILTFIPAGNDYDSAILLYQEIGFELEWTSPQLSLLRKDGCGFFLQNYPGEWADNNFMMVLDVEDLDSWWEHLNSLDLEKKYPGVKIKAPERYPWGKREIHFIDLCGVLWHISDSK